jgi:hypothetical protein
MQREGRGRNLPGGHTFGGLKRCSVHDTKIRQKIPARNLSNYVPRPRAGAGAAGGGCSSTIEPG